MSATDNEIEKSTLLFDKISMFDFGKVTARYVRECGVSLEFAEETLRELKRWFTLCALHPEKTYATGGQVDEMWHTFILFTKDYAQFCQDINGAFIHHSPEVVSDDIEERIVSAQKMRERMRLLEADYLKYFGELPPSPIWPKPPVDDSLQSAFIFLHAMARRETDLLA